MIDPILFNALSSCSSKTEKISKAKMTSKTEIIPDAENTGMAETPEQYLQLIKKIAEEVKISESGSRAPKFNLGQCRYLADKLTVAADRAYPILQIQLNQEISAKVLKIIKLLYGLAKKVESFINECCKDPLIQAPLILTNMSEHISSIGLCLKAFSDQMMGGKFQDMMLESVNRPEIEAVEEMALNDKEGLLKTVEAHLQSGTSSSAGGYLGTHLLGLLGPNSGRFKSYELKDRSHLRQLEKVGKGSAGTAYRATWLGVEVAKKTFCLYDSHVFEEEVSVLAGLSHPNIIPVLCYAKGRRECSIVMELMDEDLWSFIQKWVGDNAFRIREVVDIIFQVARGMRYLHEKKIVHGDLKSLNILVKSLKKTELAGLETEYVVAKVSDFGLSETMEMSTRYSNQTANTGRRHWMTPEAMLPNAERMPKNSFEADVYSFGMVCYEILTGLEPFDGIKPGILRILAREAVQKHLRLPDWCPTKLGILIMKCWSLDARERPCFGEICEVLREVQCELLRIDCEYLKELLEIDNLLKSLLNLDLRGCNSLDELPQTITELISLTHLNLIGCGYLMELPEGIGILKHLNHLNLAWCGALKELPESTGHLIGLTNLDLTWCTSLQNLPESTGHLIGLTNLDLTWCNYLRHLPESIGNLTGLTQLNLNYCESLQQLPEHIGNLSGLKVLNMEVCKSLHHLPESIQNLTGLTSLSLMWCESLRQLPESIHNLTGLGSFNLMLCKSLQHLPESIGNMKGLFYLPLSECTSLELLPDSIGDLNLSELALRGCESLKDLPESISNLTCMWSFDLSQCGSLRHLPETIGKLNGLWYLDLRGCKSLKKLPESISNLTGLRNLDLRQCRSLQHLPGCIGNLTGLTVLNLEECQSLQQLPESIGNLNGLTDLVLTGCKSLHQLPESIGNLNGLTNLVLTGCISLHQLPESIGNLNGLTNLVLTGCISLHQLPESISNLNVFRSLDLTGCTSLQQLLKSVGNLNGLTDLNFRGV